MNWLLNLFTTFDGRISRRDWWIGILIISAVSMTGQWIMDPSSFELREDPAARPSPVQILWSIIAFIPSLVITFKRLNDRDQPRLLGYLFVVVYVACAILFQISPEDWSHFGTREWAFAFPLLLFSSWIFIDNGFLKGTKGPNRYGPNPLDPGSGGGASGAAPTLGRTRYTGGAFARDAIIGFFALIFSAYLFAPQGSFVRTFDWLVSLYTGVGYADLRAMEIESDHLKQLDPEGERIRTERDEKMRTYVQAWKEYDAGWKASLDKNYVAAIDDLTLAIDRYGAHNKVAAPVFMWRARSFRKLGQYDKAIADYSTAIALQPELTDGYSARGDLYAELERYRKALADYDAAIRVSRAPVARFDIKRGNVLRKLDEPEQALASYEKAIERAREKYDRLAVIDAAMPDLTPAERETFLKWAAKKRDGSIRWAEIQRGIILRNLKRYEEALTAFNEAIRLQPDGAFGYKQRGWVYEKQGRLKQALADYERASELNPASDWLTKALQRVKSKLQ